MPVTFSVTLRFPVQGFGSCRRKLQQARPMFHVEHWRELGRFRYRKQTGTLATCVPGAGKDAFALQVSQDKDASEGR